MLAAMNRRSLLGGILSVPAAMVLAKAPLSIPVMVGDGEHDDTLALQALFDGKPFSAERLTVLRNLDGDVLIRGGVFRITRTLKLSAPSVKIQGSAWLTENGSGLDSAPGTRWQMIGCGQTSSREHLAQMIEHAKRWAA